MAKDSGSTQTTEGATEPKPKRPRQQRPFPAAVFEEPLDFARQVFAIGSGQPVKRLTLFHELGKSPESSASRQLIVNSGRYGLTKGGVQADNIELTDEGRRCVDDQFTAREVARARIDLAILRVEVFNQLYERFVGNKLPAQSVLIDAVRELGTSQEYLTEAVDTFIVNLRFVGLLKTLSGAERIVPIDMHLDELPSSTERPSRVDSIVPPDAVRQTSTSLMTGEQAQFESTCFYIAPIGEEGSEARKHSDLFLGSFVEPAVEEFGLKVVTARSPARLCPGRLYPGLGSPPLLDPASQSPAP